MAARVILLDGVARPSAWEPPGVRDCYDGPRDRGLDHDTALRALSNRLAGILRGCLESRTRYHEATAWSHRANLPGAA